MAEYNFTKKIGQPSLVNEGVYLENTGRTGPANNELNGLGTYVADLERFSLGNWNSIVRNNPIFMSKLSVFTEHVENGRPVNVHYEPQAVNLYLLDGQGGTISSTLAEDIPLEDFRHGSYAQDTSGMPYSEYESGLLAGDFLPQDLIGMGIWDEDLDLSNYDGEGDLVHDLRVKEAYRIFYDLGFAYIKERESGNVTVELNGDQQTRMSEISAWQFDLSHAIMGQSSWIRYKFKVQGGDEFTAPYMKLKLAGIHEESADIEDFEDSAENNVVEAPPLTIADDGIFTVSTNTFESNSDKSLYFPESDVSPGPQTPDFESDTLNPSFGWPNFTANITTDFSLTPPLAVEPIDFQVSCFHSYTIDTIYRYNLYGDVDAANNNFLYHNEDEDFDAFFNSSYPIKVHLGIDLYGQNATSNFSNNSDEITDVYLLIDILFSEGDINALIGDVFSDVGLQALNNVFYYEVVQWGDEDVLLSDDDILNSEYFAIYEQEDFSSDNFLSKRNKIIQTQNTKKISESQPDDHLNLSNHIYSTPGVKSIKIIVFRYSKDLTFLLETVLVTKNIVINDGAVLSQDFEIYGGTDFTFLPLKGHETIIGGIDEKSKYNISTEKIAKDDVYDEQDYLGKKANNKFIEQFRNGYFGKQPDKIDLSVTRVFKGASDIYSMLTTPEHTQHIVDAEFPTFSDSFFAENIHLEDNSVVTDIFINDSENDTLKEKCMIEISPEKIEFLSIENSVGNKGQGVLIGDYEVKKEKNQPIRKQGLMQTPMIEQNSEKQAF